MPRVTEIHPIVPTRDVKGSLDFFQNILGFENPWTVDEEGDAVYGGISLDGHELHFIPGTPNAESSAYFELDDVNAYHAEVERRGGHPSPLVDQFYGMRDFMITDPGGATVGFASAIAS